MAGGLGAALRASWGSIFRQRGFDLVQKARGRVRKAHDVHIAASLLAGELHGLGTGTLAATASNAVANPNTTGLCRRDHLTARCTTVGRLARIGSSIR